MIDLLHSPARDEQPELMTRDALAALAGVPRDDALIANLVDRGLAEWAGEDRVKLLQPAIVHAGARAIRMGLSSDTVLAMLPILREHLGAVANHFVDRVRQEVWQPFVDAGMPETDWPTVLGVIESLLPVAGQAVLALFREQLGESIDHALGDQLALADEN